jgi:hypothetical protein
MSESDKARWRRYEEAAQLILDELASHFGLNRVEAKQSIPGLRSGTTWEIDAKGVVGSEAFVIVECRRDTTSALKQEAIGALAYRILDTGAEGAIVVTPIGLQEGAEKVASAERIVCVRLSADATPQQFAIEFLGNVIVRPSPLDARSALEMPQVSIT